MDLIVQEEHLTESIAFQSLGIGWGFVWDRRIHSSLENLFLAAMISSSSLLLLFLSSIHPQIPYFQWKIPTLREGWEDHSPPSSGLLSRFSASRCPPWGAFSSPWMPSSENRSESPPGVTEPPRGLNSQIRHTPTRLCSTLFPKILLNYLHFSLKNFKNSIRTFVQLASWSYDKF